MKKFLSYLGLKPQQNALLDLVMELVEPIDADLQHIEKLGDNKYKVGDVVIEVSYFDVDSFDEISVTLGYTFGKGMMIILRNYIEHLVLINHEFNSEFRTIQFPVPPQSFAYEDYRKRLDAFANRIIESARNAEVTDVQASK